MDSSSGGAAPIPGPSSEGSHVRPLRQSVILLLGSAAVVFLAVAPGRGYAPAQLGVILSVPAAASATMNLLSGALSSLFCDSRHAWPGCVTLPIVHACLVFLVVSLGLATTVRIQSLPVPQSGIVEWLDQGTLLFCAAAQSLVLILDAAFLRHRDRRRAYSSE